MDTNKPNRKGERLVTYHPDGTKAALLALAASHGQRSVNGLLSMIVAHWLRDQGATLSNVPSQHT